MAAHEPGITPAPAVPDEGAARQLGTSLIVFAMTALLIAATSAPVFAQGELLPLLKIRWTRGANLPQGFQDSDGGLLGDELVTVAGFCSGGLEEDNRRKPGRYPRGFLKKGWSLDLGLKDARWQSIPEFPGAARQGLSAARVGTALFFWGGFSYSDPYCYADGWRLSRQGSGWKWEPLPALPWPVSSPAMSVVGTRIFAFGGADYDAQAFYTEADRSANHKRLGARLLVLDTQELQTGWKELPACPGTPRWVHTMAAIGQKLFAIGGASGNISRDGTNYGYCSVVDNWAYDTARNTWSRLVDLPISSGNFPRSTQLVFKERYIILPGGHQYDNVLNPDGTIRKKYGVASRANPASGLHNDVFVYDTSTGTFGTADRLPIDNNLPMTVVRDDRIFLLGGETGGGLVDGEYYGHHPDLLLVGKIEELP